MTCIVTHCWEWPSTYDQWHSMCTRKWTLHQHFLRVYSSHTSRERLSPGLHLLGTVAVDGWSSLKTSHTVLTFLTDYSQDPSILTRIVTSDKTWIHYFTPSTKKQTMVWKWKEEPAPKKARMEKPKKRWWWWCSGIMKGFCIPNTCELREGKVKLWLRRFIYIYFFLARWVLIGTPGLRATGPLPYTSHLNS